MTNKQANKMSSTAGTSNLFKIKSSDGKVLEVPKDILKYSNVMKTTFEEEEGADELSLNFNEKTLQQVFEFCKYQTNESSNRIFKIEKPLKFNEFKKNFEVEWYPEYINGKDLRDIHSIILCSNYLDIPLLLELGCAKIASEIKGKDIEEVKTMFEGVC